MSLSKINLLLLALALAGCSSVSPEDARMSVALCGQGKAMLAAGKKAEARDIYQSATFRDESNARAWNGLGVAHDLLGKHGEAKEAYRRALDLAPDDMTAANNLAHLYVEEGDAGAAVKLLAPYRNAKNAPSILKQNLAEAEKKLKSAETPKAPAPEEVYADLGSYATQGMAEGQLAKAKRIVDNNRLTYAIEPQMKTEGGTPAFVIKAKGDDPKKICRELKGKALSCTARGK